MRYLLRFLLTLAFSSGAYAVDNSVNVYVWSGVIPDTIIRQFEQETGIKVNFSTYDSNEIMYAKLKTDKNPSYDIVEPSSYYTDRMRRQDMLEKLDKSALPNFRNLNPDFLSKDYDPKNEYAMPFIWGITGIFINKDYYKSHSVKRWADLWNPQLKNQLLLLDDPREAFAMGLRVLGYSATDTNPEHIHEAYLKLKTILPNVKIFNSSVLSLLIDEDTTIGQVWNGDLYKAKKENPQLEFIYPEDGFVIWLDHLVIPKNAPHKANALKFLNFIMRPDIGKAIALDTSFPIANAAAQKLLPESVRDNPTIYPPKDVLKRGEFQKDISEDTLALYESYWERLKMEG